MIALLAIIFVGMAKMSLDVAYGDPPDGVEPMREGFALLAGPVTLGLMVLLLGLYLPAPLRLALGEAARALGGIVP